MGSERASKTRQREAGRICCACSVPLGSPPPGYCPGLTTGERFCLRCDPDSPAQPAPTGPRRVLMHVGTGRSWCVHFVDDELQAGIGPWLLFDTLEDIRTVCDWAGCPDAMLELHASFAGGSGHAKSHGSATLTLTPDRYAALRRRARGWPWNGYELQQMKDAGRYPPARLTPAQERIFLQRRHK